MHSSQLTAPRAPRPPPRRVQQSIGACGGSGWLALQMGLGKTAVAIATILLNPPPAGWRTKRPWKDPVASDYLGG